MPHGDVAIDICQVLETQKFKERAGVEIQRKTAPIRA